MSTNVEDIQNFGKMQMEAIQSVTNEFTQGLQAIASEASAYSKKSFENSSAFASKLAGVKSLNEAIQLQSEFAKSSYEDLVALTTKLGELYMNVAKAAYKPVETAISKVQAK